MIKISVRARYLQKNLNSIKLNFLNYFYRYVLNQYKKKNEKSRNSFLINQELFLAHYKNGENFNFLFYVEAKIEKEYFFIVAEYCKVCTIFSHL